MITAGPLSTTDLAATVRASIHGDVVTPDEPSFAAASFGATGVTPELVIVAADAGDVGRVAALAARAGRRVVAQITGRPAVVATESTILLVTRLLATVRVDPARRTATIGIGASWRQVLDAAEPFGLTALSAAASVGVSGAPRAFAFAADRIRSFEVVTAAGEHRRVGRDNPHFYALRHGETAPGLVVAMTLDLVPQPSSLIVAELTFAGADAEPVLAGWQRWAVRLPRTAVTGVAVGDDGDTLVIRVAVIGDAGRSDALVASLRGAVGVIPVQVAAGPATTAGVARGDAVADRLALAA
ncbi:FAD-binding protein [Nakamurella sp.]|uniref:FAD-binding protein n=1 Tax=Nakamurella sp. TaxID=1869182 RepID=UPI003783DB5A